MKRENNIDYYAFSSVCRFRYLDFDGEDYDDYDDFVDALTTSHTIESNNSSNSTTITTIDFNAANLYPRVAVNDVSQPSFASFVSVSSTETYSFNQNPYLYKSKAGTSVQYIAMIVDFNPEAISFIYSTYLGDSYLENNYLGQFHFACDWALEVY